MYQEGICQGWLKQGQTILDPFGGVATGAYPAQRRGLNWIGIELEEKFVAIGRQNLALWESKWGPKFSQWVTAQLLQGDSRQLMTILEHSTINHVLSSPPFGRTEGMVKGGKFSNLERAALARWRANQRNPQSQKVG